MARLRATIKGAVDPETRGPPLSGILASHGTSVKRPGGCLRAATDGGSLRIGDMQDIGFSPSSCEMGGRSLPVLVWLGTLAIVLAVSLVATAQPHVRRKQHLLVLEYRAVTPSGAAGRQRS